MVSAGIPLRKDYSISIELRLKMNNVNFLLTVVYGPTESRAKASFLNEQISCQPIANIPWLYIGDFNLISDASDKNNANINRRQMRAFRQALDASELIEIRLVNQKYTWSNCRLRPTLVHLDKAFCNRAWDDCFPPLSLLALSSTLSDHCPLLLCNHQLPLRRASFRFEHFWTRSPDLHEVVQAAWELPVNGSSPMMILHNKFVNTARALRQWSKSLFSKAKMQFHMASGVIQRLEVAQESRALSIPEGQLLRDLKQRVLG